MKHKNMTKTQRHNHTQFLLMNEIHRTCTNTEWNELARIVATYLWEAMWWPHAFARSDYNEAKMHFNINHQWENHKNPKNITLEDETPKCLWDPMWLVDMSTSQGHKLCVRSPFGVLSILSERFSREVDIPNNLVQAFAYLLGVSMPQKCHLGP